MKINQSFAIGIPTLNRWDLLNPALLFYLTHDFKQTHIYVVDNGQQDITIPESEYFHVIRNENNVGVAASWNQLCNKIYENHKFAFILNDDVYLGKLDWEIELLLSQYSGDIYIGSFEWSSFILPKSTYLKVGQFDENFYPAYFEDNDYLYRMRLEGLHIFDKLGFISPLVYRNSQTAEKMPEVLTHFEINKNYYISKWGGEPNKELFTQPFNNKSL